MNEISSAIKDAMATYPFSVLMGMMVAAWTAAMVLIALGYRFLHTLSALKKYDAACRQVEAIEAKMLEMVANAEHLQRGFDQNLADARDAYNEEMFELQQIIFERNSEILELKNKMLVLNKEH